MYKDGAKVLAEVHLYYLHCARLYNSQRKGASYAQQEHF